MKGFLFLALGLLLVLVVFHKWVAPKLGGGSEEKTDTSITKKFGYSQE